MSCSKLQEFINRVTMHRSKEFERLYVVGPPELHFDGVAIILWLYAGGSFMPTVVGAVFNAQYPY